MRNYLTPPKKQESSIPYHQTRTSEKLIFLRIITLDINDFTLRIDQWPGGIHPSPHSAVGGAQGDIPGAPTDPWFFIHHAGLDLVWDMWSGLEEDERRYALPIPYQFNKERETRGCKFPLPTYLPHDNDEIHLMIADITKNTGQDADFVTPDSYLEMSPVLPGVTVRDVMSISNGPLCYVYE